MHLALPDDSGLPPGAPLHPVSLPASKSAANRALLLAALAPGESLLRGGPEAEDTRWMRSALRACGVSIAEEGGMWRIRGGIAPAPTGPLFLGASGTALRFLLPWLALHATGPVELEGDPRLFERPLGPLEQALGSLGARLDRTPRGLALVPAPRPPAALDLTVDASLSSQFLTGLALVAGALPEPSVLRWSRAASPSYLRLTDLWLRRFGCASRLEEGIWRIPGGGFTPADLRLPLDWSGAAAFYVAAAATSRSITLGPWDEADEQGDRRLLAILESAGCRLHTEARPEGAWIALEGPLQAGLDADLSLCPDLGPVLAAAAALAPAPSELRGLDTLRFKECDRLEASAELIRWLGGEAHVLGGHTLRVRPGASLGPRPPYDPRNDHRMAFAAAVGALRRPGSLSNPACVAKTFPDFWIQWNRMLGH